MLSALLSALVGAFDMLWDVLWPLALGFILSAIVQTLVSREAIARSLGSTSVRSLRNATLLGAASSSCSYAAVAIARALFRKGASFPAAIVFQFASTNLVFELGLILLILLGWPFLGAELAGGLLMIVILAVVFRWTLTPRLINEARQEAELGRAGRMEGHGAMDMSVTEGPFLRRLVSARGLTAVSHYFWMDLTAIWTDLGLGFLIAGALAAWVPSSFWQNFFFSGHPLVAEIWGPLVGPVIAMLSFVCSVGNVPLAAVLWSGGISFGGAIAFIFADLLILPILDIYRKYYGWRMAAYLAIVSYVAMAAAGLLISLLFQALHAIPGRRAAGTIFSGPQFDYTSALNLLALLVMALLGWRFLRTGGLAMLRMMEMPVSASEQMSHDHQHHHH